MDSALATIYILILFLDTLGSKLPMLIANEYLFLYLFTCIYR